eukprot:6201113-Pleurochrysis_carterae.AAC.1
MLFHYQITSSLLNSAETALSSSKSLPDAYHDGKHVQAELPDRGSKAVDGSADSTQSGHSDRKSTAGKQRGSADAKPPTSTCAAAADRPDKKAFLATLASDLAALKASTSTAQKMLAASKYEPLVGGLNFPRPS